MGKDWHVNEMLLKKNNTFIDFITCAEYLVESKYYSKDKVYNEGRSACGLFVGAVVNLRPDLFKIVIAEYPFFGCSYYIAWSKSQTYNRRVRGIALCLPSRILNFLSYSFNIDEYYVNEFLER